MNSQLNKYKKIILVILDGFGIASHSDGNSISNAQTPNLNNFVNNYPALSLQAAGPNVGLTWGEPGNSEVGHSCIGAGRIVLQDLPRINDSISTGEFYNNPAFLKAMGQVKRENSTLHIIAMLGDAGVHGSQQHLHSLLAMAKEHEVQNVIIHAITDGRDSDPQNGVENIKKLDREMLRLDIGTIGTVAGRFYAMDRAEHWDLTEKYYNLLLRGEGLRYQGALEAVEAQYSQQIYDETVPPLVIGTYAQDGPGIRENDAIIMTNFRQDRAIQITRAFTDPQQVGFSSKPQKIPGLLFVSMTQYAEDMKTDIAFPPQFIKNSFSEVLSQAKLKQFHVAEREKYAHVTYFFDSGRKEPYPGEEWKIVKSSDNYQDRYQNVPQMEAAEVTQKLREKFSEDIDFMLVNYANPDMVGHTGNYEASIKAVEAIDKMLGKIYEDIKSRGDIILFITADHGNVEELKQIRTGEMVTSHTTNPVPFLMVASGLEISTPRKKGYLYLPTQTPEGLLSDVTPTLLDAFDLKKPKEMTGISLLDKFLEQK